MCIPLYSLQLLAVVYQQRPQYRDLRRLRYALAYRADDSLEFVGCADMQLLLSCQLLVEVENVRDLTPVLREDLLHSCIHCNLLLLSVPLSIILQLYV